MDIFACAFVDPIIIVAINLKWTWYVTWQEKWFQNKFCCCFCEFVYIYLCILNERQVFHVSFFINVGNVMQTTSIKFHLIILSIFNCDSVHNRRVCPKIVDRLIAYWEIVAVAISLVFVVYFVFFLHKGFKCEPCISRLTQNNTRRIEFARVIIGTR